MSTNVPNHFETYLGQIERGWSVDANGEKMPFHVAQYARGAGSGTVAFSTLGLGRHELTSPSGKVIHHELLMLVTDDLRDASIPSLLQQVATQCLKNHWAVLRGDVLGPRGPLAEGSKLEAFYVTGPAYHPPEFAVCTEDGRDVVVAWLVPITVQEAQYVRHHGWSAFEDLLTERDPT